jgi:polyphosphate kinase 2 (PPK2 family)
VHPEILCNEGLSGEFRDQEVLWDERYQAIENFETYLHSNGTHVVKIFLHLSKEEQRNRFLDRIDELDKNWKFSLADVHERKYWDQYARAFEECVNATSTEASPWFVVPADDTRSRLCRSPQSV